MNQSPAIASVAVESGTLRHHMHHGTLFIAVSHLDTLVNYSDVSSV
jgi:hypothetical protein